MHPYFKEAIKNVSDFVPNEQDFLNVMEMKAYNSFSNIVVKALDEVLESSSNSV